MQTTELAARVRAKIEQRLAVCEATTTGIWRAFPEGRVVNVDCYPVADCYGIEGIEDARAAFIAASRNERPDELRALLGVLDTLTSVDPAHTQLHAFAHAVIYQAARDCGILEDK